MKVCDPQTQGQRWKDKKGKAGPSQHVILPGFFFLLDKVPTLSETLIETLGDKGLPSATSASISFTTATVNDFLSQPA